MNTITVFTQKDMNDICAILSRNGYIATAYNIVSSTENTCCGKQWRIDYYDPINRKIEKIIDETTNQVVKI